MPAIVGVWFHPRRMPEIAALAAVAWEFVISKRIGWTAVFVVAAFVALISHMVPVVREAAVCVQKVPVVAVDVIVVVFVPWAIERFPAGAVMDDQAVAVLPEQAANEGVPPATDTKQRVPAPPVAVCKISPEELA